MVAKKTELTREWWKRNGPKTAKSSEKAKTKKPKPQKVKAKPEPEPPEIPKVSEKPKKRTEIKIPMPPRAEKEPATIGRPPKIHDAAVVKKFLGAIRTGNYIETAAAFAGLTKSTVYEWMKAGARENQRRENGEEPDPAMDAKAEFSNAVEKALAEAEVRDVLLIGKAAEREWQAAAWRLERKFPARYGRKVQADVQATVTNVPATAQAERALATEEGRLALETLFHAINGGDTGNRPGGGEE